MKKIIISLAICLAAVSVSAQAVKVAAAANLRNVLTEIKEMYIKEYPKEKVDITFGSSGKLTQQILNGAPFEFFMAANKKYPMSLQTKGATSGKVVTYAYGKLVMWSSSVDVSKGKALLTSASVKKISVAKPETAPYGDRTIEYFKRLGLFEDLGSKIVYADNIAQAAQFAYTGNAELGFTAMSLVLSPDMQSKGKYYIIPEDQYSPIEQACVLLKSYNYNPKAAKFMKYVLDKKLAPVWEKWGYKN